MIIIPSNVTANREVTFDAVGPGKLYYTIGGPRTFNHTATAGATIIFGIGFNGGGSTGTVTYGGTAMTYLGASTAFSGNLRLWSLFNAPGGQQEVSFSDFGDSAVANVISFNGASSITGPIFANPGASASQSPTCNAGEMIVQTFGWYVYPSSVTGGTLAYNANNYQASGAYYGGLALAYSPTSTTFSYASSWNASMGYLVLKP